MSDTVAARWEEYNEAGRHSFSLGQFAEAEELFRAAVREGEQLGSDSPHLATSLNALGQLRLQAKDLVEAEACFTRALTIRERTYGPDSHAIVPSLNNLSAVHDAKGETDKAVDMLRRSLVISDQALGISHPEVAVTLNNLAKLYFKRRDFAKADRLLLKLLETKKALGRDHPELATVLGSLAKLRQAVGKHGAAEQLWRQALSIRERAFAPNDAILATTIENVADCCAAQEGRLGDAIALRERAIGIREIAMGATHPSLAAARAKLDELRSRPGAPMVELIETAPLARTSQEVPSPIFSHEVPPFPAAQPRAPSPDLPWIQLDAEPTGERAPARLELMGMEPPMVPQRPNAQSDIVPRTPLASPRVAPFVPRASNELVFTDSLAPDSKAPPLRQPAKAPLAAPPPSRATRTPQGGSVAHRAPPRRTSGPTRPRRRSKAPLVFVVLLVAAGAGGWYTMTGRTAAAALLAPVISRVEHTSLPVILPRAAASGPSSAAVAPATPATVSRTNDANAERAGARMSGAAGAANQATTPVRATRKAAPRDTTAQVDPATDASDTSEATLNAPIIPVNPAIDSITRGIDQSTRAKVDSAQKTRLDARTPIFKKP